MPKFQQTTHPTPPVPNMITRCCGKFKTFDPPFESPNPFNNLEDEDFLESMERDDDFLSEDDDEDVL